MKKATKTNGDLKYPPAKYDYEAHVARIIDMWPNRKVKQQKRNLNKIF